MMHQSTTGTNPDPILKAENLSKTFGKICALDAVELSINKGEFFCLLGGSGSGKTTLLRLLAGLETPDHGKIEIEGQDVTSVPPWKRHIAMMFQSYALFPHMSVEDNIAYGLKHGGNEKDNFGARVSELLKLVQLNGFEKRQPQQLSGGQRQRVALARALAAKPKVLLLDEPLSALDRKLREETQQHLTTIHKEIGTTFVMVTHDQEEAMTLADRIGILEEGSLIQVGTPDQIYHQPANRTIASFIGRVNLFEAIVKGKNEFAKLECHDFSGSIDLAIDQMISDGQSTWIAVRPENIIVKRVNSKSVKEPVNTAEGTMDQITFLGGMTHYRVTLDSGRSLQALGNNNSAITQFETGDRVEVSFLPQAATLLTS